MLFQNLGNGKVGFRTSFKDVFELAVKELQTAYTVNDAFSNDVSNDWLFTNNKVAYVKKNNNNTTVYQAVMTLNEGSMYRLVKAIITQFPAAWKIMQFVDFGEPENIEVEFLDFGFQLYDIQIEAIQTILNSSLKNISINRGLLSFATNAGKTEVMANIAYNLSRKYYKDGKKTPPKGRTLIISYDASGAEQTFDRLKDKLDCILLTDIGVIKSNKVTIKGKDVIATKVDADDYMDSRVLILNIYNIETLVYRLNSDWFLNFLVGIEFVLWDEPDKITKLVHDSFVELCDRSNIRLRKIYGFTGTFELVSIEKQKYITDIVGMPYKLVVSYAELAALGQSAKIIVKYLTPTFSTLGELRLDILARYCENVLRLSKHDGLDHFVNDYEHPYINGVLLPALERDYKLINVYYKTIKIHSPIALRKTIKEFKDFTAFLWLQKALYLDDTFINNIVREALHFYYKSVETHKGMIISCPNNIEIINKVTAVTKQLVKQGTTVEAIHGKCEESIPALKKKFTAGDIDIAVSASIKHGLSRKDISVILFLTGNTVNSENRQIFGRAERRVEAFENAYILDLDFNNIGNFKSFARHSTVRRLFFESLGYEIT